MSKMANIIERKASVRISRYSANTAPFSGVSINYAKRAEEDIAKTDYIARASGCLLHRWSCKYLLGKSCDCDRREDVQTVAGTLRGFDMAHLSELQAAHAAGVAEGKGDV